LLRKWNLKGLILNTLIDNIQAKLFFFLKRLQYDFYTVLLFLFKLNS